MNGLIYFDNAATTKLSKQGIGSLPIIECDLRCSNCGE